MKRSMSLHLRCIRAMFRLIIAHPLNSQELLHAGCVMDGVLLTEAGHGEHSGGAFLAVG